VLCGVAWSLGWLLFAAWCKGRAAVGCSDGASDPGGHVPPENADWLFALWSNASWRRRSDRRWALDTDNYTWRWIFYINLPVGIVALWLVVRFVEIRILSKRRQIAARDYIGFGLLALGGSAADSSGQGTRGDLVWSNFILTLAIIAGVAWFAGPLRVDHKEPIGGRALFKNLNFSMPAW